MFSNKKKSPFPSIISSDVEITGQINNAGTIQLEGCINGEVNVQSLTIGSDGRVEGDINAQEVIVKGTVKGTIKAKKVVLEQSATVVGDIFHDTISIQEGASIQGSMTQTTKPVAPVSEKENKKEKKSA
jgi:cytoskeletal protein CcmA (bactofilin family)